MVLLWYFRGPVSGLRARETRTSHVRGLREMSRPAFRARSYLRLENGHTRRMHAAAINVYCGIGRVLLIEVSVVRVERMSLIVGSAALDL